MVIANSDVLTNLKMFEWDSRFSSCTSRNMFGRFDLSWFILSTITWPVVLWVTWKKSKRKCLVLEFYYCNISWIINEKVSYGHMTCHCHNVSCIVNRAMWISAIQFMRQWHIVKMPLMGKTLQKFWIRFHRKLVRFVYRLAINMTST